MVTSVIERPVETGTAKQNQARGVQSRFNVIIPLRGNRALVYNSFTGAFAAWSKEDIEIFDKVAKDTIYLNSEKLGDMLKGGFVVSDEIDELNVLERKYNAHRYYRGKMIITFIPTLVCNFTCDYCFQGQEKQQKKMTPEVQDAAVDFIERSAPNLTSFHAAWYGGEPLLQKSIIYDLSDRIISVCRENLIHYGAEITTNGWFLNRETAKELKARRVSSIQVTLDGPPESHDGRRQLLSGQPTFKRIVENLIDVATNVPISLSVRINVDSRNEDKIKDLLDHLAKSGLSNRKNFRVYFAPVEAITVGCHSCSDITMSKTLYGEIEAGLARYAVEKGLSFLPYPPKFLGNCAAVRPKGFVLLPDGEMHKCWDTIINSKNSVGTIFETSKLLNNEVNKRWQDWTPFKEDICRDCNILPSCVGFCAYKFLYKGETRGEAGVPCPSWKYNINERLFLRAEKLGIVSGDDWDEKASPDDLSNPN